jgi:hypothetical protein
VKKRISGKSRAGLFVLVALAMAAIAPAAASAGVFDDTDNRGPIDSTGSHFNEGYNDGAAFQCDGLVRYQGKKPSYDLEYDFSCDSFFVGYVISSNKLIDSYDTESIVTDSEGVPSDNAEGFDCEGLIPGNGFSCRGNGSLDLDPGTSGQQMPSLYSISQKTSGTGTDSGGNTGVDCSATSVRLCLSTASSYTYEKTGALPDSTVIGRMGTFSHPCSKTNRPRQGKSNRQRFFLTVYGYRYVEKIVSLDVTPAVTPILTGGYKLTSSQPILLKGPAGKCVKK